MGCVLGIFFGRCIGGLRFLRYLGFQGAASLALKAIPPHWFLYRQVVQGRHGCSSWYVLFIASFTYIDIVQLYFYLHDERPVRIDRSASNPAYDNDDSNGIIIRCIFYSMDVLYTIAFRSGRTTQVYLCHYNIHYRHKLSVLEYNLRICNRDTDSLSRNMVKMAERGDFGLIKFMHEVCKVKMLDLRCNGGEREVWWLVICVRLAVEDLLGLVSLSQLPHLLRPSQYSLL